MPSRRTYSSSLAQLLKGICKVPSALDTYVSGLAIDSRLVKQGDLFLAMSGNHTDSTDHIKEAILKGANAVVAEGLVNQGNAFEDGLVVELFVDNLKANIGVIADRFFRSPSQDLAVIGVTGTNGKTSVTNYLASYFAYNNHVSAVIGTLGYGLVNNEGHKLKETGFTTPNVVDVHRCLAELRDAGAQTVFMEVSSHGLSQGRVDGVQFDGAVFTNLTREHLDYHGTMAEYAASKFKLFQREGLKFAVVNEDDDYASQLIEEIAPEVRVFTYGVKSASDVAVNAYELNVHSASSISADVTTPVGALGINSGLIGLFNLSNLLAVLTVAVAKQELKDCEQRIQGIQAVKGRMQVVQTKNMPVAIVDYAHTPDALRNALEAIKPHCQGKLIVVFGCGGDRDNGKREEMAKVAAQLAELSVVTNDNPRTEAPEKIIGDIIKGFDQTGHVYLIEADRRKAISLAFKRASSADVILIAGKGHETWQDVNGERVHFSDIEEVERILGLSTAETSQIEERV
ncbi:MAG: UDP-N-acetylmuramoyl-L-alanyl-D-glutamate--2,6-diaminopimelate ligase [Oleiphilus sp.]